MTNFSKLFGKIKQHSLNYLKTKTSSLSPSQRRCVNEIFYGLFESGNVTLSDIARSLNEEIKIEKTINRLSKNLSKEDFSAKIEENHLNDLSKVVDQKSIIVIDDSDILKPRAKNMEYLCPIRYNSTDKTGMGYNRTYASLLSEDRTQVKTITNKNGENKNRDVFFEVKEVEIENIKLYAVVMKLDDHSACVLLTNHKSQSKGERFV